MATRSTTATTTTYVKHVARPLGQRRENGPHLGDLREFVEAATGLPDEVRVRIDSEDLSESGRRNVTFEILFRHPAPEESS